MFHPFARKLICNHPFYKLICMFIPLQEGDLYAHIFGKRLASLLGPKNLRPSNLEVALVQYFMAFGPIPIHLNIETGTPIML
jgi:hypothetical protein